MSMGKKLCRNTLNNQEDWLTKTNNTTNCMNPTTKAILPRKHEENMAKTIYKEVTTKGAIEWAKIFEENRDMNGFEGQYEDSEGAYVLTQVLNKDEFEKLKKAGTMKKPIQKRLMDGEIAIKFERRHLVKDKSGKEIPQAGGAPKVVGPDGKRWDVETQGLIGNGTIAEVTNLITTFPGQDGKTVSRTSLTKIKIVEHIPYVREEEGEDA